LLGLRHCPATNRAGGTGVASMTVLQQLWSLCHQAPLLCLLVASWVGYLAALSCYCSLSLSPPVLGKVKDTEENKEELLNLFLQQGAAVLCFVESFSPAGGGSVVLGIDVDGIVLVVPSPSPLLFSCCTSASIPVAWSLHWF
jgi:hypothetical protein